MTEDITVAFETTIPEYTFAALKARGLTEAQLAADARLLLAIHYFESDLLSLGQAADLAGHDRWRFIELLSRRGIAVIDLTPAEMADELKAVDELARQLKDS